MIGQTHSVTFTASNVKVVGSELSAQAVINLDRTTWGLKYGSGKFFKGLGDKMIKDDFSLTVDLKAMK